MAKSNGTQLSNDEVEVMLNGLLTKIAEHLHIDEVEIQYFHVEYCKNDDPMFILNIDATKPDSKGFHVNFDVRPAAQTNEA